MTEREDTWSAIEGLVMLVFLAILCWIELGCDVSAGPAKRPKPTVATPKQPQRRCIDCHEPFPPQRMARLVKP